MYIVNPLFFTALRIAQISPFPHVYLEFCPLHIYRDLKVSPPPLSDC